MAQTFATLLFLLIAGAGITVIAASLIDDWTAMMRALGFVSSSTLAPLPQSRTAVSRQTGIVRVIRRPDDRRAAAA